ncbi:hypothetical protein AHF37_05438 [Paragonimus kellicotti]|nr:hypothetical protein AHF37_05438 [Paragonimus kellicotti]
MVEDRVVTVRYRPLKPPEAFFTYGRPLVDPKRPRLYLARRFDFLLLLGLVLSLLALLMHVLLVVLSMPETPEATNYVTSSCANLEGEWNKERNVLRFWAVPYAVPPVTQRDSSFPEVLYDIAEKFKLTGGGYRWHKTITVPHTEYCFLTFDERCSFRNSQWTCEMRRPNRTIACVEVDNDGQVVAHATEHCLTLDIAMPVFTGKLLPVIVVFTGFRSLRNPLDPNLVHVPAYLPTDEAVLKFGAIWVNARYRVGPFGSFYDFNTLGSSNEPTDYVNFGLRDQRAVLMWVQHSIGRFGGDASRVVILAHDTGATGALQLVNMQAQRTEYEPWFRAVWLASGAVNWYDPRQSKWQHLKPFKIVNELHQCDYGHNEKELSNSNLQCARTARETLMNMPLPTLAAKLSSQYSDANWAGSAWDLIKFEENSISMWFSVDKEFDQGTPVNWTRETIEQMFYQYENRSAPSLAALVFSSMQSEYEGYPGVAENDGSELRYLLDQVIFSDFDGLFDRLGAFESARAKSASAWPRQLTQQEYVFNALSAIRYTCPQAWLLGNWLFNSSALPLERTRFYHIYHHEAPRYPYTNVPGVGGNRRLPFHGLDMLILTGNYQRQGPQAEAYKNHLWTMFDQFVHEYRLDERCEVFEPADVEDETPKPALGCELNSAGPSKPVTNFTLHSICSQNRLGDAL